MKRGRPPFRTEEEKKAAKRRIHTRAMRECKWYCEVCQRKYSLECKTNHLSSTRGRFGKEPIRAQYLKFGPIREPYLAHMTRLAVRSIFGDWYRELGRAWDRG